MKTQENWEKEFDKTFYEIMGLEVDPYGTDGMYLIRNSDDEVENGINFTEERDEIKAFISDLLTTQKQDFERARNSGRTMFYEGRNSLKAELRELFTQRMGATRRTQMFTKSYDDGHDTGLQHAISLLDQVK